MFWGHSVLGSKAISASEVQHDSFSTFFLRGNAVPTAARRSAINQTTGQIFAGCKRANSIDIVKVAGVVSYNAVVNGISLNHARPRHAASRDRELAIAVTVMFR